MPKQEPPPSAPSSHTRCTSAPWWPSLTSAVPFLQGVPKAMGSLFQSYPPEWFLSCSLPASARKWGTAQQVGCGCTSLFQPRDRPRLFLPPLTPSSPGRPTFSLSSLLVQLWIQPAPGDSGLGLQRKCTVRNQPFLCVRLLASLPTPRISVF
jgi:hypothetical protein